MNIFHGFGCKDIFVRGITNAMKDNLMLAVLCS